MRFNKIIILLVFCIFITSCTLIPITDKIEDISVNPEKYVNENVIVKGTLTYPFPNKLYNFGVTKKLVDVNGFSILVKPNVSNEIYDRKTYTVEGILKSVTVCDCEYSSPNFYDKGTYADVDPGRSELITECESRSFAEGWLYRCKPNSERNEYFLEATSMRIK